ncbi:MAG: ribonuclease P protein component [candidate division Zixibacteria bacterium]|nr:ribonuclease P protein component [candidate division Zixibacteria bacterium]
MPKDEKNSAFQTSNFPKDNRLHGRNAIRKVIFTGRKITGNIIEIRYIDCESTRFAISVPKKFGKAVARNRIKRIIREFLRHNKDNWPENNWIIIRMLGKTENESLIIEELRKLLSQIR